MLYNFFTQLIFLYPMIREVSHFIVSYFQIQILFGKNIFDYNDNIVSHQNICFYNYSDFTYLPVNCKWSDFEVPRWHIIIRSSSTIRLSLGTRWPVNAMSWPCLPRRRSTAVWDRFSSLEWQPDSLLGYFCPSLEIFCELSNINNWPVSFRHNIMLSKCAFIVWQVFTNVRTTHKLCRTTPVLGKPI